MNTPIQTSGTQTSILAIAHAVEIKFASRNLSLAELTELFTVQLRQAIAMHGIQRIGGMNLTTSAVVKGDNKEARETTRFSVYVKAAANSRFANNGHKKAGKKLANQKPNLFTTFVVDQATSLLKVARDNRFDMNDKLVQAAAKALVTVLIEQKNAGAIQELKFNCNGSEKAKYVPTLWNYETGKVVDNTQSQQGTQTQIQGAPLNPTGGQQILGQGLPATAIPMLLVNIGGKCLLVPQGQVAGQSVTPIQVDEKTIQSLGLPVQSAH